MAKKILSIAIGNEFTRVCELSYNKFSFNKQVHIHRSISFKNPDNTINDGYIINPKSYGRELKNKLNEGGFKSDKAIFSISSGKIATREVTLPPVSEKKIMGIIKTGISELFPIDIKDYVMSCIVLENTGARGLSINRYKEKISEIKAKHSFKISKRKSNREIIAEKLELMDASTTDTDEQMTKEHEDKKHGKSEIRQVRVCIYAVPSSLVNNYYSFAKSMHLDIVSLDYSGNSSYQILSRQGKKGTNVYLQLNEKDTLVSIFKDNILILQRTIGYGIGMLADLLIEQGFDGIKSREDALRLFEQINLLTPIVTGETSFEIPTMERQKASKVSLREVAKRKDHTSLAELSATRDSIMSDNAYVNDLPVDIIAAENAYQKNKFAVYSSRKKKNATYVPQKKKYAAYSSQMNDSSSYNSQINGLLAHASYMNGFAAYTSVMDEYAYANQTDEPVSDALNMDNYADNALKMGEIAAAYESSFKANAISNTEEAGNDSLAKESRIRAGKLLAEALAYLTESMARILDYYRSNHGDERIGTVYLSGPGLRIQGINNYINFALGLRCKKMFELACVRKTAQSHNIYPGEYISCIGAVLKPANFIPKELIEKRQWRSTVFTTAVFSLTCLFASVCVIYAGFLDYRMAKQSLADIAGQLNELPEIDSIYERYELASQKLKSLEELEAMLANGNDYINDIIHELEKRLPTGSRVSTLQFSKDGVSFSVTVPIFEAGANVVMAKLFSELGKIPYFESVEISNDVSIDETSVVHTASYHISCNYTKSN